MDEREKNSRTSNDEALESMLIPYASKIRAYRNYMLICALIMIAACIYGATSGAALPAVSVFVIFFAIFIVFINKSAKCREKYNEIFNEHMGDELEKTISEFFGPQLEPAAKVTGEAQTSLVVNLKRQMQDAGLFDFNQSKLDSYRKGIWNGKVFEAYNTILTKETTHASENADVVTTTVFDGVWFRFDSDLDLDGRVIIREAGDTTGNEGKGWNVIPDNEEFADIFRVYAENPENADKVLTQTLMQKLLKLRSYSGGKINLVFSGYKVNLALETDKQFLSMSGGKTEHISDLRDNLHESLKHTAGILDILLPRA